jgi:hypothetical protein
VRHLPARLLPPVAPARRLLALRPLVPVRMTDDPPTPGSPWCARPGCTARVAPHRLACWPHWRELPFDLRAAIVREYHVRPGGDRHLALVRQAIRAWRAIDESRSSRAT